MCSECWGGQLGKRAVQGVRFKRGRRGLGVAPFGGRGN